MLSLYKSCFPSFLRQLRCTIIMNSIGSHHQGTNATDNDENCRIKSINTYSYHNNRSSGNNNLSNNNNNNNRISSANKNYNNNKDIGNHYNNNNRISRANKNYNNNKNSSRKNNYHNSNDKIENDNDIRYNNNGNFVNNNSSNENYYNYRGNHNNDGSNINENCKNKRNCNIDNHNNKRSNSINNSSINNSKAVRDVYHSDGILVRDATHEDYHGVITIDEGLYKGRDYLPYTYHRTLGAPCSKAVVCEAQGNVIGYAAGHLIDGGETLVLSSGRVKGSFRGQGHTKKMLEEIRSHFRIQNANLKQELLLTKGENLMHTKAAFREQYVDVLRKALFNFIIPKENHPRSQSTAQNIFEILGSTKNGITTSLLNADETAIILSEILAKSSFLNKELLGSDEFLITNWMPFGMSLQNTECIIHTNDCILFSGIDHRSPTTFYCYKNDHQNSPCGNSKDEHTRYNSSTELLEMNLIRNRDYTFFDERSRKSDAKFTAGTCSQKGAAVYNNDILKSTYERIDTAPALSIGNYFPCKLGLAYNIDIYFSETRLNSMEGKYKRETIGRHIDYHIQHARNQSFDEAIHLILFVSAERNYQHALVCDVMNGLFGLKPEKWEVKDLHLYQRLLL